MAIHVAVVAVGKKNRVKGGHGEVLNGKRNSSFPAYKVHKWVAEMSTKPLFRAKLHSPCRHKMDVTYLAKCRLG